MTNLLINNDVAEDAPLAQTRFGGLPSVPPGSFTWPVCRSCEGNMQFLGQLQLDFPEGKPALHLLFMCQNDPGCCSDWEAGGGANKVIVVDSAELTSFDAPTTGEALRACKHGASVVAVDETDYDEARTHWAETSGGGMRQILGQIGGKPVWVQGEETPSCDHCKETMSFVAQLEEGPDFKTSMNFGGGSAYVFRCGCHPNSAKMLWQC